MNDSDNANEFGTYKQRRDAVASGLLPRDRYRPSARLEIVDEAAVGCPTERLYCEVPVRVDGVRTVLLVGPWCELDRELSYRVLKVGRENVTRPLVTVEIVVA